jgi:SH3-like domain-containing protein
MIGVAVIAMLTAFKKGDTAYSKKVETPLLAEPKPLAAASAKVGFAEKLEVDEVRGSWLHVSAKNAAGWIFQGNVWNTADLCRSGAWPSRSRSRMRSISATPAVTS